MTNTYAIPDTNLFVAAGFNPHSSSAKIIELAKSKSLHFSWNQATLKETRFIIQKIPPLSWEKFTSLFASPNEFTGKTKPQLFNQIEDPDDRKFAALAHATHHPIITNDQHFLSVCPQLSRDFHITIHTPSEFIATLNSEAKNYNSNA